MTLSIKERFMLLLILPREGNLSTIRIVQALRAALSFSEEEHTALGITNTEDGFRWNPSVPQTTDIEIGPKAHIIIQDALKRLDKDSKLTEELLGLYERFVES